MHPLNAPALALQQAPRCPALCCTPTSLPCVPLGAAPQDWPYRPRWPQGCRRHLPHPGGHRYAAFCLLTCLLADRGCWRAAHVMQACIGSATSAVVSALQLCRNLPPTSNPPPQCCVPPSSTNTSTRACARTHMHTRARPPVMPPCTPPLALGRDLLRPEEVPGGKQGAGAAAAGAARGVQTEAGRHRRRPARHPVCEEMRRGAACVSAALRCACPGCWRCLRTVPTCHMVACLLCLHRHAVALPCCSARISCSTVPPLHLVCCIAGVTLCAPPQLCTQIEHLTTL